MLFALLASPLHGAGAERPQIVGLSVGFAGRYKVGCWAPVSVVMRGGSDALAGRVQLVVPDGDGVSTIAGMPGNRSVQLLPGADTQVSLYAKIGRSSANVEVRFVVDGRVRAEKTFSAGDGTWGVELAENQELIVLAGAPAGMTLDPGSDQDASRERAVVALVKDPAELPTQWYGYDGADAVLLASRDRRFLARLTADDPRIAALDQWVRMGGKLVLSVGREAPNLVAPGKALARFAPGRYVGLSQLKASEFQVLQGYAQARQSMSAPPDDGQPPATLDVARFDKLLGTVDLGAGPAGADLPLVIRTPHGLGEGVFFSVDLDQPPLSTWKDRAALVNRLLGRQAAQSAEAESNLGNAVNLVRTDLSAHLRSSLERFAGVSLVPFALVALIILIYIALVGPLDYMLVKRVLKRMELTWITFPAIVILFSVGAYYGAYWLKGDKLRLNQVDLVDYDVAENWVRGTTWSTVFSPRHDSYNLSLALQPAGDAPREPQMLFSWLGVPGGGLGGMASAGGGAVFGQYALSDDLSTLAGMPIPVWSTKAVVARWSARQVAPIRVSITDEGKGLLSGTIANRSGLTLSDCVLVYESWVWPLATLSDGQTAEIRRGENSQSLESFAGELRLPRGGADLHDDESHYLPEIMSLHSVSKVETTSGLVNRYQRFTDMGGQLRGGRAVLLAFAQKPATRLLRDGQPLAVEPNRSWTCYRFAIPVRKGASGD